MNFWSFRFAFNKLYRLIAQSTQTWWNWFFFSLHSIMKKHFLKFKWNLLQFTEIKKLNKAPIIKLLKNIFKNSNMTCPNSISFYFTVIWYRHIYTIRSLFLCFLFKIKTEMFTKMETKALKRNDKYVNLKKEKQLETEEGRIRTINNH